MSGRNERVAVSPAPTTAAAGLAVSKTLSLPLNTVTSTLVVYGGKGQGKTNLGAVLVEELKRVGQRFSVLDPVGVWFGLQFSASGRGPGIEVMVLGGLHGDLPIEPTGGAVVADLVADEEVDVVIDISRHVTGKMWSQGEKIRFVTDYCTRLYERQGERMRPLHQVIDEAGRFVPQQIPSGAQDIAKCVGAIEQMVELGRNVGVGVTLITQRSARMNKSVSELADAMIAFRTVGPRSVDAILDWFGEHVARDRWKALIEQLRSLPVGTALVVSPGWLQFEGTVAVRARRTFDSSATPETGTSKQTTGKAAKPDLTKYRDLMAATIEKAKASDPRELRQRIAQLETEAAWRTTEAPQIVERIVEVHVEVPLLTPAQTLLLGNVHGWLQSFEERLHETREVLGELLDRDVRRSLQVDKPPEPSVLQEIARDLVPRLSETRPVFKDVDVTTPIQKTNGVADFGAAIPAPMQRILDALRGFEALKVQALRRSHLALYSGASPTSSAYKNNLGRLRTIGLIGYPSQDMVALTDAGRERSMVPVDLPRTDADFRELWYARLSDPQVRILRNLVFIYPSAFPRRELAAESSASPTSSAYKNNLGHLRALGLIEYPAQDMVAATALLFPNLG